MNWFLWKFYILNSTHYPISRFFLKTTVWWGSSQYRSLHCIKILCAALCGCWGEQDLVPDKNNFNIEEKTLSHTLFIKLQYLLAKNFLFLLSLEMQTVSSDVISVNWMLVQNVSQWTSMAYAGESLLVTSLCRHQP